MITSSQVFAMLEAINDCVDKAGKGEMRGVLFLKAAEEHGVIMTMRETTTISLVQPEVDQGLFAEG